MSNPQRVAFYIRSADSQSSIDMHVQRLTQACADQGRCLVQIYVDHGFSGIRLDRPSLQRMLEDAENRLFDEVMIPALSHLSRRTTDLLPIFKKLQEANIKLTVPGSECDMNSAFSIFAVQIMNAISSLKSQHYRSKEC